MALASSTSLPWQLRTYCEEISPFPMSAATVAPAAADPLDDDQGPTMGAAVTQADNGVAPLSHHRTALDPRLGRQYPHTRGRPDAAN
jgi:hypothetical protein